MQIKISPGNIKANIPNVSLPPVKSCGPNMPCIDWCYARKAFRQYPNVRRAWESNLALYMNNPTSYFDQIIDWVRSKKPRLFRFGVGGDMPDQLYIDGIYHASRECNATKFLAFTKRHDLEFIPRPQNLSIVASFWPAWGDPDKVPLPKAWMQDGTETRISKDAIECFGKCDSCGVCWSLAKLGKDVYFHKH